MREEVLKVTQTKKPRVKKILMDPSSSKSTLLVFGPTRTEEEEDEVSADNSSSEEPEEQLPDFLGNLPRFEEKRRKQELTDVMFRAKVSLTTSVDVGAHKIILSVASPYFENLFKDGKNVYEIPFPPGALNEIFTFIYTGRVPKMTEENLEALMELSNTFQLTDLFSRCRQNFKRMLNLSNYKKFEDLLTRYSPGDDIVKQLMHLDFANFSQSPEFIRLSIDKIKEIVGHKDPKSGPIPSALMLQGILNWVQSDIHSRQKHLLSLMQFINFEEAPAEMTKLCMITLNASLRNEGTPNLVKPSTLIVTKTATEHEIFVTPVAAEEDVAKNSKPTVVNQKEGTVALRNQVSNTKSAVKEVPPKRVVSVEKIWKESPKELPSASVSVGKKIETRELRKKRPMSQPEGEVKENVKKSRVTLSSERVVDRRTRSSNKHHAESGMDFTKGNEIANTSIGHPLMFYISPKGDAGNDIMVYDFMSKESGVLIENACLDAPRSRMVYLNRKLYLIGGRTDAPNETCEDTVLYYSDFPKISSNGLLRTVKWLGETPVYTKDCLMDARSNCSSIVVENSIYVLGGRGPNPSIIKSLNTCEKFQTGGSGWTKIKPMKKYREAFGTGAVQNSIYAIGGWVEGLSSSCPLEAVERYDTERDQWFLAAPLPTRRCSTRVATLNSCLYAFAGSDKLDNPGKLGQIDFLDPREEKWTSIKTKSALPVACREGAVAPWDGKIISIESNTDNGVPLIEVFEPRARNWITDGTLPADGLFSSAAFINMA